MSETVQELLGKPPRSTGQAALDLLLRFKKESAVIAAMILVLAAPFLLRPSESNAPSHYDKRLVIMTPHHEMIRQEFGHAFARYWKKEKGETIYIDWRVAGTAELTMMMRSDFTSAFQQYWKTQVGQPWTTEVASSFMRPNDNTPARQAFLDSNVGIGVDLFFGGGPYDFNLQATAGVLVAKDKKTGAGLGKLAETHPEWFTDEVIPAGLSGQVYRDKEMRWCGTCLSSFGIVYNRDVLRRLGVEKEPTQWADLADPKLIGHVVLADPTKSGSVTMAFEMILQQEMQKAVEKVAKSPGRLRTPQEIEAAGVRQGWITGLQLIQRISANARYFTDSATKIPLEVARGDAAAGMCIDFYGRSAEDHVRLPDGSSRVGFVAPAGGTAISVDSIGMMRGAPQPDLAAAFMEWVISEAGQKIWSYKKGMPGGPEGGALRRLPLRKDFYTEANKTFMSDATEQPWEKAKAFTYRPEWTGHAFSSLRFLIRVMCVDTHRELKKSWSAIVDAGQPPRAVEILSQLTTINYDMATKDLVAIMKGPDAKIGEVREAHRLTEAFRRQYAQAADIASVSGGRRK